MMQPWQKYWQAYQELGNYSKVALKFGVAHSTVGRVLQRAARQGKINLTAYENPPGFTTGKVTVQTDAAGNIEREWRRIHPEAEDIEEWVASLCERAYKAGPKIKASKIKGDTAIEIPIGDMHVGMYSWKPETGVQWDTDRACNMFKSGVRHLIGLAPKTTGHAILADLGDFIHADNKSGTTEKSGNPLDMSGRWIEIVDKARDAWIEVIATLAERFASVHVVMTPGNHNPYSSHWMARIVDAYFRNCKHVTIDTSPKLHRYHEWEKTLLGYAHGHLLKRTLLAGKMASDMPAAYARTIHRHWREGHIHHATKESHKDSDETHGVTIESYPTLAPGDAYHKEHGYEARRLIQGIIHHKEYGEVARHTAHARMLGKEGLV